MVGLMGWFGVIHAGISHQDCPLGDAVASGVVPGATVDGMLIVEATACRVALDQLVTHGDWEDDDDDDNEWAGFLLLVMYRLRRGATDRTGRPLRAGEVHWWDV